MKKLLIIILSLISILGIFYLVIKGKIPIISNIVLKQVDLGVNESSDIIYSYYDQIGFINNLNTDTKQTGELVFEGGIELEHTFTQKEINSWFRAWEESWAGIPFQNLQVRLNPEGAVEASSLISIKEAESIGKTLGYTDEQISKAKTYLKYIPDPLPLYAKGSVSITQDDVSINIQNFKVVNVNVPESLANSMGKIVEDVIERARNLSDSTTIKRAVVTPQGVEFVGTVPASVSIKK